MIDMSDKARLGKYRLVLFAKSLKELHITEYCHIFPGTAKVYYPSYKGGEK